MEAEDFKNFISHLALKQRVSASTQNEALNAILFHLLMSGINIREVQELLGHKNVETTMTYTHVL